MAMVKSYRDLIVWQRSMQLVASCYQLSARLPKSELYGLTSQIRRAAVSVPANIAEGHSRKHTREYVRHLSIAFGSLMELETHLMVAERVGMLTNQVVVDLLTETDEVGKIICVLKDKLRIRYEKR